MNGATDGLRRPDPSAEEAVDCTLVSNMNGEAGKRRTEDHGLVRVVEFFCARRADALALVASPSGLEPVPAKLGRFMNGSITAARISTRLDISNNIRSFLSLFLLFFLRRQKKIIKARAVRPTTAPTTIPAIAPLLKLHGYNELLSTQRE